MAALGPIFPSPSTAEPSVSIAIKELENSLGTNLFYRHNKRLILTREGEYFLSQARVILEQVERLQQEMASMTGQKNHIRIGIPPMIGVFLFPVLFNGFHGLYPKVKLEIQEYGSAHTWELVANDELDLAIVIADEQTSLRFHTLDVLRTSLVFCVARGHPLSEMASLDMSALKDQTIVLMRPDSYQHEKIFRRFQESNLTPQILLHSNQLYTIKQLIQQSGAGAFLFDEIVRGDPELVGIPLNPPIPINISLIWKRGIQVYSDAALFIDFVRHTVGKNFN